MVVLPQIFSFLSDMRLAWKVKALFGCIFFITQFSLFNFRHLSLITHRLSLVTLKYHTRLAPSLTCHHSIFFNYLWDPHTDPMSVDFSLSFFFPLPLPFIFPCFSLLFSSSMLTHFLIKPTMILIFMLFPDQRPKIPTVTTTTATTHSDK